MINPALGYVLLRGRQAFFWGGWWRGVRLIFKVLTHNMFETVQQNFIN